MRRLLRPASIPATLKRLRPSADADTQRRLRLGLKTSFRQHVYAAKDVRKALDGFHLGKCAYCEADLRPVTKGEVEHFRPKGEYVDERTGERKKPGYGFLAYEWSNLLLSCSRCNGAAAKGVRFPLEREAKRATNDPAALKGEVPMLIDPSSESPRRHLRFRKAICYPVMGSRRGYVTRSVINLNDPVLVEARRQHIEIMEALGTAMRFAPTAALRAQASRLLAERESTRGAYLACVKDYFHLRTPA